MILFLIVHQPYTERGLKSLPKGSWCSTTFVGGKLDLPKIEKLCKVCYNVLTCTKISENNVNFKQSKALELFIALKMPYSCCFSKGENLDFLYFLQKKFYVV